MGTIFCLGESMIMLYPQDTDVELQDAQYFKKHIGGHADITSYSIACLGGSSGFIGCISSDGFGKYIRYILKSSGVNLSACTSDDKIKTPIVLVKGYENPGDKEFYESIYCKRERAEIVFPVITKEDILHLSPQY